MSWSNRIAMACKPGKNDTRPLLLKHLKKEYPMPVVEISHLYKRFGDVQAVDDVSFAVESGEIFGLLGPNGAGKTTTIRMMLDIFKPDSGEVCLFGGLMTQDKKHRIGYLPEERGLYKDQPLEPTLVYLATLKGLDEKTARSRLKGWLERLDLAEHARKKVQELSKGMQQKAQIIATLLHEPEFIIVDEPFSGLDPVNTRLIQQILEEQRLQGRAIMMSTHAMNQVEALCNRIVLINRGKVIIYDAVDAIKRQFSGNSVLLQGEGNFSSLPGVMEARKENGAWHLALSPGTNPHDVLRSATNLPDTRIERFELTTVSLDDIFVQVVQEAPEAEEAYHA
jgi:ABC-2 type transport system ATP-binding protein